LKRSSHEGYSSFFLDSRCKTKTFSAMSLHPRITALFALISALRTFVPYCKSVYHECRLSFVVALTHKRFKHAVFIINGKQDSRVATSFRQLELLTNYHTERLRFNRIPRELLIHMWCSRKLIKIGGKNEPIRIVTHWHY